MKLISTLLLIFITWNTSCMQSMDLHDLVAPQAQRELRLIGHQLSKQVKKISRAYQKDGVGSRKISRYLSDFSIKDVLQSSGEQLLTAVPPLTDDLKNQARQAHAQLQNFLKNQADSVHLLLQSADNLTGGVRALCTTLSLRLTPEQDAELTRTVHEHYEHFSPLLTSIVRYGTHAQKNSMVKKLATGTLLAVTMYHLFFNMPPQAFTVLIAACALEILIFEWKTLFDPCSFEFWGTMPFYPILPILILAFFNENPRYRPLLFMLCASIVGHDFGAYVAGKCYGKHKLAPTISPNKTWEGFAGGTLVSWLFLTGSAKMIGATLNQQTAIPLALGVSIVGCMGDLFESMLKRRAGVKDTSTLLPEHGGLLDRLDSIFAGGVLFFFLKDYLVDALKLNT